ncbi:MAG: MFS transporter [Halioglobus sp.]
MKGWTLRRRMMVTLAVAWFLSYADRVNMSVASIPMQEQFGWDETTKGLVMGSVFLGYICSQLLGGWIVDRVSAVKMIGFAAIAFSLTTLATPYAAELSFSALIVARVLLGVAEGFMVPATYAFIGRWSPDNERARLLAIVVSGATIGAPGGLILSGFLVDAYGWQSAFYVFGIAGIVWAGYWLVSAADSPALHPRIKPEEIPPQEQLAQEPHAVVATPVRQILRHPAVWALIINKFAALWMVYVFLAWLPTYFNSVQGISLAGSGLFAALPWLAMSAMLYVASGFSDGLLRKGRDIDFVRKLMQTTGLLGACVFLFLIPFASSAGFALVATCMAMAFLANCYSGADPTIMEMVPHHRGFVTGLVGTLGNLPGVIAIPLIGWLVDTTGSFSWGFITAAGFNLIAVFVWLVYGTGRRVI